MKRIPQFLAVSVIAVLALFANAQASFVNAPVPGNAYITLNGFDWAWAGPCPSIPVPGGSCGSGPGTDLTFQSAFGWHIPTAAELALAPLPTDFVFPGANVPFGATDLVSGAEFLLVTGLKGDAACATPYFNTLYHHCDFADGPGGAGGITEWAGLPGGGFGYLADQLVDRVAAPEPSALLLLGSGLAGVAGLTWRRARRT